MEIQEMIERNVVNDRPATIVYYDEALKQIDRYFWVYAKIMFDDGEVAIVRRNVMIDHG
jgi:hypothetical protein